GTLKIGTNSPAFDDLAASITCPSAACIVAGNVATATINVPAATWNTTGTRSVHAIFTGNGSFSSTPVNAAYDQVVNPFATTITDPSFTTPITFGTADPLSVTLGPAGPFTVDVSFRDQTNAGSVLCVATPSVDGVATCTPPVDRLSGGGHTIFAVFPGDATHSAVESHASLVVTKAPPSMTP